MGMETGTGMGMELGMEPGMEPCAHGCSSIPALGGAGANRWGAAGTGQPRSPLPAPLSPLLALRSPLLAPRGRAWEPRSGAGPRCGAPWPGGGQRAVRAAQKPSGVELLLVAWPLTQPGPAARRGWLCSLPGPAAARKCALIESCGDC